MKFNEKYPVLAKSQGFGPLKSVEVEGGNLLQTFMYSPCSICRTRTGWRDLSLGVSVPACSEECRSQITSPKAPVEKTEPDPAPGPQQAFPDFGA